MDSELNREVGTEIMLGQKWSAFPETLESVGFLGLASPFLSLQRPKTLQNGVGLLTDELTTGNIVGDTQLS